MIKLDIGRKIYFELSTGNVLQDCGERSGCVIATTQDQDFTAYTALKPYQQSAVDVISLAYGQDADKFSKYKYHIDPTTKLVVFDLTTEQVKEVAVQLTTDQKIAGLASTQAQIVLALVMGGLM